MEESANRKLRLKAMRMEAAEAEVSPNIDTSTVPASLSNPLAESASDLPGQESSPVTAKFDFYTDPMAAFSGDRRKCQKTYQNSPNYSGPPINSASPGPGNLNTTPYPHHQTNQSHPSHQRIYEATLPYQPSVSFRSPTGMASPSPQHIGPPPAVWNGSGGTASFGCPPTFPNIGGFPPNSPNIGGLTSPGFGRGGSPTAGRGSGYQYNNNTIPGFGQRGSPNPYAGTDIRPQFNNTPNPGFDVGDSPNPYGGRGSPNPYAGRGSPSPYAGRGSPIPYGGRGSPSPYGGRGSRPQYNNSPNPGYRGSPSPNTGRSSGQLSSTSLRPGPGSGRGKGKKFHHDVSAQERPEMYFNKSMLEDPWRLLTPVVRNISVGSWLPKYISKKKETISGAVSVCRSGLSFAESLAASYEEAAALAASYEDEAAASGDVKDA